MNILIKRKILGIIFSIFFTVAGCSQDFFSQSLLPKPSGPFAVGLTKLSLTDSSRTEKYTHHTTFRKVHIDIWYPAEKPQNQNYIRLLDGFSSDLIYNIFKSKGVRLSLLDSIKQTPSYSFANANFAESQNEFPIIIFNPGFYFGMAPLYSAFMENLASQGYIVCSISHPYEQPFISFTDGETVYIKKKKSQLTYLELWLAYKLQFRKPDSPESIDIITRNYLRKLKRFDVMLDLWMEDIQFVLDYLFYEKENNNSNVLVQKMNLDKIGTFGQSFGGAVSGQLCLRDFRVNAGVNLDGFQFGDIIDEPIPKPFMLIQSGYNDLWNYGNSAVFSNTVADYYFIDIPKARHLVFSDAAILPNISLENRLDMLGNVDGLETLNNLNKVILEFFDIYLKDKHPSFLSSTYPFEGASLHFTPQRDKYAN